MYQLLTIKHLEGCYLLQDMCRICVIFGIIKLEPTRLRIRPQEKVVKTLLKSEIELCEC